MKTIKNFTKELKMIMIISASCFFSCAYAQTSSDLIDNYLKENRTSLGLTIDDVESWVINDEHKSSIFDLRYVYVNQTYHGIRLYNALANFGISGSTLTLTGIRFEEGIAERSNSHIPDLSALEAIESAAQQLNLSTSQDLKLIEQREQNVCVYSCPSISMEDIPVKLMYFPTVDGSIKLVWDLSLYVKSSNNWWSIRVDASNGQILDKTDWVKSCQFGGETHSHSSICSKPTFKNENSNLSGSKLASSPPLQPGTAAYNVYPFPAESPIHGNRSLVINPANPIASPFGWHDVNGISGPEFTSTRGNNVCAREDMDYDDLNGYAPDNGTSLHFNFPLNLNQEPIAYQDASITNLFYANNIMHDVWYQYGFDEASGNFQENNYGNSGAEADMVYADAQDGYWMNNADFATPPDGTSSRMNMYLWTPGLQNLLSVNSPSSLSGDYLGAEASFGPGLPSMPMTSDLALYVDGTPNINNACEVAINGSALFGRIVVLRRGGCNFVDKVLNAQNAGAIAVIVVNTASGQLISMGGIDPGITIPSIMISFTDGNSLIAQLQAGNTINATLQSTGAVNKDGSLDNGIIAHEYGHGISTRLSGGASNSNCLDNDEQMGEGWSDWFALMLTIEAGDLGIDERGIGAYVLNQTATGGGLRPAPYSTDFNVNNFTYAATNSGSISMPHGIGFVWGTMIWDLTWELINQYGFDQDLYNGNGGNNIAMHLIINGLKLQPCSPGFVDARDAILQADMLLYNGANQCLIWNVFANRGLGYSANQGSPFSRFDQVEAFDFPPNLPGTVVNETVVSCDNYFWSADGNTYSTSGDYTVTLSNIYGCDSTVNLNLTINNSVEVVEYATSCGAYTSPIEGTIYTSSGDYITHLTTVSGCDSAIVLILDVIDTEVSAMATGTNTIQATVSGNYPAETIQWINCANGTPISGATDLEFISATDGVFAAVVTASACSDTSNCVVISNSGTVSENKIARNSKVYPNPTTGKISIDLGTEYEYVTIRIINGIGKVIVEEMHDKKRLVELLITGEDGHYIAEVSTDTEEQLRFNIIKTGN